MFGSPFLRAAKKYLRRTASNRSPENISSGIVCGISILDKNSFLVEKYLCPGKVLLHNFIKLGKTVFITSSTDAIGHLKKVLPLFRITMNQLCQALFSLRKIWSLHVELKTRSEFLWPFKPHGYGRPKLIKVCLPLQVIQGAWRDRQYHFWHRSNLPGLEHFFRFPSKFCSDRVQFPTFHNHFQQISLAPLAFDLSGDLVSKLGCDKNQITFLNSSKMLKAAWWSSDRWLAIA